MKITKATVILNEATDKILLHTDFPSPFTYEMTTEKFLVLEFDATYDAGADYVRKVFEVEPEIINTRKNRA